MARPKKPKHEVIVPMPEPDGIRDVHSGKFVPGHPQIVPPGLVQRQISRRKAIMDATTDDEAIAVVQAMGRQALAGGKGAPAAAAVFLAYTVGPVEKPDMKEAMKTIDVLNLNKPASELTPEQRRQRLALLIQQQQEEKL